MINGGLIKVTEITNIGSPIKSFIEKIRKESIDGLGDWELKTPIELELNAIVSGKVGGGMDIQVVNFGAKVEAEQQQKIKLSIGPKDDVTEAERKGRIAESEAKIALSEKIKRETGVRIR